MVPILMPLNYVVALVRLHNVSGGGGSVLAARFIGLLMHKVSHCCCVNGLVPVNSSCWQVDIYCTVSHCFLRPAEQNYPQATSAVNDVFCYILEDLG